MFDLDKVDLERNKTIMKAKKNKQSLRVMPPTLNTRIGEVKNANFKFQKAYFILKLTDQFMNYSVQYIAI